MMPTTWGAVVVAGVVNVMYALVGVREFFRIEYLYAVMFYV